MSDNPTRSRILDAAEGLFAVHGFDGTSVRAICNAAGANVAAVHYYFQGKDGVAEAVFERRMVGLAARRREMLDRLDASGSVPSVQALMEALVLPLAELIESEGEAGWAYVKAFAALLRDRPGFVWKIINKYNADNMERVIEGLYRALPQFPPELVRQRMTLAGETLIYCLASPVSFALQSLAG